MRVWIVFAAAILVLLCTYNVSAQSVSQRKRKSKEVEDRINKMDEATKQRIFAMKAAGMPKEAIAEKISYTAGGKNIAKRIVDALHDEPEAYDVKKKQNNQKKSTASKPSNSAFPGSSATAKNSNSNVKPPGSSASAKNSNSNVKPPNVNPQSQQTKSNARGSGSASFKRDL